MLNFISFIINCFAVLLFIGIGFNLVLVLLIAAFKTVNLLKKAYISLRIKQIQKIELYPRHQTYRRIHEKTGYSIDYKRKRYIEHYRVREKPNGYSRKVRVFFTNGRSLSAYMKETSTVYEKIMKQATNGSMENRIFFM